MKTHNLIKMLFATAMALVALHHPAFGQWTQSGAVIYNTNTGNVGIGTASPQGMLHVSSSGNPPRVIFENLANASAQRYVTLDFNHSNGTGARIRAVRESGNTDGMSLLFYTQRLNGSLDEKMRINGNGNVSIGTTDPEGYLFAVAGDMVAEEVVVKLEANWPDYVFDDDYELRSLNEVRRYIEAHGHLPDVPSAAEVEADGVRLGEMGATLLQKIEELTLYLMDQHKRIEAQEQQNQALKQMLVEMKRNNDLLEARLSTLKSR